MPAESSAKTKSNKKKDNKGEPAIPEKLSEDDRIIEVRVRATVENAAAIPETSLQSLLHGVFCGEDRVARLDEVFTKAEEEPPAKSKQRPTPALRGVQEGDVDFVLFRRSIHVDLPTLSQLLYETGGDANEVVLHAPPPPPPPAVPLPQAEAPGRNRVSSGGRGKGAAKGKANTKEPHGAAEAAAAPGASAVSSVGQAGRGKQKALAQGAMAKAGQFSGERLASVRVSLLDVMHATEHEYPLELNTPGVVRCRVVLCCQDSCLTPLAVLKRFRPFCFTVYGVHQLPEESGNSGGPVRVLFDGLGHRITSPPLEHRSVQAESPVKALPEEPFLFRAVRFLGDRPTLSVYQNVLLDLVRVSVLRCRNDPEGLPNSDQGNDSDGTREKPKEAVLGSGGFSVRDFVTDKQTLFDKTVPLLPLSRATAVASGERNCLTAASSLTCTVEFFVPLPPLVQVRENGDPAPRGALMTRGVAVMPYSAPWMPSALDCLLKQLMVSQRATKGCDVKLYVEPPPPPPVSLDSQTVLATGLPASMEGTGMNAVAGASASEAQLTRKSQGLSTTSAKKSTTLPPNASKSGRNAHATTGAGAEAVDGAEDGGQGLLAEGAPPKEKWPLEEDTVRIVSPAGISGFEVCDCERRILCIEGPASEVHRIFMALHKTVSGAVAHGPPASGQEQGQARLTAAENLSRSGFHLLMNPELFMARRLYTAYPPLVTPPNSSGYSNRSSESNDSRSVEEKGGVAGGTEEEEEEGGGAAPSPAPTASVPNDAADVPAEVDEMGGGCGGRIHRIRLRETIPHLMAQQRFLLRRTLSEACLRCILQLDALASCPTLREAATRGLFPSAASIISLERSFGQTLELPDIFGRDAFVQLQPSSDASVTHSSAAGSSWDDVLRATAIGPGADDGVLHLAAALDPNTANAVGRLVSFQGTTLVTKQRAIPAAVAARHPRSLWMVSDDGTEALCAFGSDVPGGTIRYHVEGQVVETASVRMLYVLEFHTLAKSFTNSRNPLYEKALAQRRQQEKRRGFRPRRFRPPDKAAATPPVSTPTTTSAVVPCKDDSDEDDDNDAGNPPFASETDGMLTGWAEGLSHSIAASTVNSSGIRVGTTRTSELRAMIGHAKKEPEPDYDLLWHLYEKRAPKRAAV